MIPTNQPQGLPRAPHADLLMATLPYESLANSVCGYASRYLGFSKKKIAVLAAWLAYLQEHSNRVWPSEETLANLAAVSISTVRRVKAILRATLKIQPVDADKLHSGPGPHDYQGEKRSRREVDTYDLSPLLGVLPPPMVDLLLAPPHAQKPKPDAPQPPAQNIQPNDTHPALVDATGFPDPLSDPAPAVSISATAENPNPSEVPASHARSVASHSVCSVSIEREGQADSEGPNVPAVKKEKKAVGGNRN